VFVPSQLRAARAATGWTIERFAEEVGVTRQTLAKMEAAADFSGVRPSTVSKLRSCLEAQGIEFVTVSDGSPGIIIRQRRDAES
jgi:transcriptional regulator with XRE-family HTH domain